MDHDKLLGERNPRLGNDQQPEDDDRNDSLASACASVLRVRDDQDCDLALVTGIDPELIALAQKVADRMKTQPATDEEIIRGGVAFIMGEDYVGPDLPPNFELSGVVS